jgi:pilus assembly protein Flp/PilA
MLAYLLTWVQLKTDRRGVTALEYGLIAGVIGAVLIGLATTLGPALAAKFGTITTALK